MENDKITIQRIQLLHPRLRDEVKNVYDEILLRGVNIRFTATLRTFAEQDALYAQGRTKPGPRITNARGGQSYHNYGLALDFCLLMNNGKAVTWDRHLDLDKDGVADWEEVVYVFKLYQWEWGGDWTSFKDFPHLQKTFGKTIPELLAMAKSGQLTDGYPQL